MQLLSLYVSIYLCSMIKHYCASSCVIAIFVCVTILTGRPAGNSQFQGFCDEISTQTSFRSIFYSIVLHYICTLFLCWDCFHMFGLGQVMVWRTNFDQTARAPQGAELTNLAGCMMFQFCNCAHYQLLPITWKLESPWNWLDSIYCYPSHANQKLTLLKCITNLTCPIECLTWFPWTLWVVKLCWGPFIRKALVLLIALLASVFAAPQKILLITCWVEIHWLMHKHLYSTKFMINSR